MTTQRVAYFYDSNVGSFYYGADHPMKPFRIKMTHQLILNYGLYRYLNVFEPHLSTNEEMIQYHAPEYIKFLEQVSPAALNDLVYEDNGSKFNIGENDCPIFDGLYNFHQLACGGSIDAAVKLNYGLADICVNWAGGLHHAKKSEASGFCYVNDIVLSILELLKHNNRVLYIDIDVHHGDGVEEAFYTTDRVMTTSFHMFGDFFPGTGDIKDVGAKAGKYYTLNVPLKEGIDDVTYVTLFKTIMGKVIEKYVPNAIVIQCGADSLAYDRLGPLNLTLRGHGACVSFIKSFSIPLLVLGGGGYTIKNVARCWCYETSLLLNREVANDIPANDYYEYYAPDHKLHIEPKQEPNQNSIQYIELITQRSMEQLKFLDCAPSVPYQDVPNDFYTPDAVEARNVNRAQRDDEFYPEYE